MNYDFLFSCLVSKPSRVPTWTCIAKGRCAKVCIAQHTRGLRRNLSRFSTFHGESWSLAMSRWSFGANRVQVDSDIKILVEFLSHLHTDTVRGLKSLSSLSPSQSASQPRKSFQLSYCTLLTAYSLRCTSQEHQSPTSITCGKRDIQIDGVGQSQQRSTARNGSSWCR